MRQRLTLSTLLVTSMLATAACSASQSGSSTAAKAPTARGDAIGVTAAPAASGAPAAAGGTAAGGTAQGGGTPQAAVAAALQRSIIRTATLTVRTSHVADGVTKAEAAAQGLGGLVGDANITTDPDKPDQTTAVLELRVPGDSYDALMKALSGLGQVVVKSEKASDVTTQVVDVESRLATQRKSLEQVRTLLSRAGTLPEILQVEADLTRREADLESLEAQRKILADQTALATIDLTLVTPKAAPPPPKPKRHLGFVTGLLSGWHGLTATTIVGATALGAALPFTLPVLLLAGIAITVWRRRRPVGPGVIAVADAD